MICRLLIIEDDRKRIEVFQDWLPEGFNANFVKSAGRVPEILEPNKKEKKKENMIAGICQRWLRIVIFPGPRWFSK